MLGKLGQMLNKDVGSLVKDAGKVLNADVGDIVKGAGKVLNTDLGDLLRENPTATPEKAPVRVAGTFPTPPVSQPPPVPRAPAAFDPDATIQLNTPPLSANPQALFTSPAPVDAAGMPSPAATTGVFSDETLTRSRRPKPTGTLLTTLLPYAVGDFARPQAVPAGDLTSDPATAIYGVDGETVVVKLVSCWDAEEAIETLSRVSANMTDVPRLAPDRSWVLGETAEGVTFAWVRESYAYTASTAKGVSTLGRFLSSFPY